MQCSNKHIDHHDDDKDGDDTTDEDCYGDYSDTYSPADLKKKVMHDKDDAERNAIKEGIDL